MEFKLKDMSYGLLLSHTFPGFLVVLEILLAFALFTKFNILAIFYNAIGNNLTNITAILFTAIIAIAFIFSTLIGFIIDGIHHFIYEDIIYDIFYEKIFKKKTEDKRNDISLYKAIKNTPQMQIYKFFVEDNLYYPAEAFANISIAMAPGIFLLPYFLKFLGAETWLKNTILVVYVIVFLIMIYESYTTLKACYEEEDDLIEVFSKDNEKT